ncbi:MAG: methyltransferase [Candidatus Altarchaeum sp. CG12_big_fil_rev_8_21_14_0_65_33_22]|nr:MAG: hypothetical protein AUK59_04445 [Candidatus Altarchaeum sp. CG2_30_32_3053]PIN67983.1 MAG: methyltransferase [Candidatus Altarchaeum sp. CG12_big_fil_rev_8_21_14_0_65_33_22]
MKKCRVCKSKDLKLFLSLGRTPLANSFLEEDQLKLPEEFYPLNVCFCESCGFVQLAEVVPAEKMFKNYIYVTSTSEEARNHYKLLVEDAMNKFKLPENSLVVEFASNDGTLLKNFRKFNVRVLGVEPAENIAPIAEAAGIETINDFFNRKVAKNIVDSKGKASMIIGTNVFAHIDNLDEIMKSFQILLDDEGVIIIESPYLVDFFEKTEYDTIYHEHVSYLSLIPLVKFFGMYGFKIFDVKRTKIHGGSIKIFASGINSKFKETKNLSELLLLEKKLGLDSIKPYLDFALNVQKSRVKLLELLYKLKLEGKKIIGYGAAAKGNTLLNYCNIGTDILDYIVDKNPLKQGKYTPGTNIPVVRPDRILKDHPDYMLILAWNFADEIMKEQHKFKKIGEKFIIPIPEAKII